MHICQWERNVKQSIYCHHTCLCHLDLLWCHLRDFPAVADSSGAPALITGVPPTLRHRSSVARRPLPGQQLRNCVRWFWFHCDYNTHQIQWEVTTAWDLGDQVRLCLEHELTKRCCFHCSRWEYVGVSTLWSLRSNLPVCHRTKTTSNVWHTNVCVCDIVGTFVVCG